MNVVKRNLPALIFATFVTFIVMWGMLLPGYILSLDLVFTPYFHLTAHSAGSYWNSFPLYWLIKILYLLMPGWLVEKLLLGSLFFLMSFLSFHYLPSAFSLDTSSKPKRFETGAFASLLYTANTFVYVRMLSGQWTHLFAYALLPLFLYLLFNLFVTQSEILRTNKVARGIRLGLCLALIAVFSLQLFLMCLMAGVLWMLLSMTHTKRNIVVESVFALASVSLFTSYWIIPAFIQNTSVIANFTEAHWQAFAASAHTLSHGSVPVLLNLISFGGFWGERYQWATYFSWPQANPLFWLGWSAVTLLAVAGTFHLFKKDRFKALFFILTIFFSFIFAAGDAPSIVQPFNLWLFRHISFWAGFRDSQKFIAFFALSMVSLSALGFEWLITRTWFRQSFVPALFLIPLCFGIYVWGGFHGQLKPVYFPQAWTDAKNIADKNSSANILILPWQGYFSLGFDHNLLVANPASQFFGPHAVTSQNFLLNGIYDQAPNKEYFTLDQIVTGQSLPATGTVEDFLQNQHIGYIIFFQDIRSTDPFQYSFIDSAAHSGHITQVLNEPEVKMDRID